MQVKAFGAQALNEPMKPLEITRRALRPQDLAFEVLYCGICHSDLHTIKNDRGNAVFPLVPGHEILGRVTAVGDQVSDFKLGDLVGVGCIVESCQHCQYCAEGEEQFCEKGVTFSFNSPDKISGGMTYGGFSKTYVCEDKYVLHMPPFQNLAMAAPLLCAGITVYSPLKHWQVGPGKKVGILGIGGLGHLAIKITKAMGATVTVFTTSPEKLADAQRLGADSAVLTTDHAALRSVPKQDFILDTISAPHNINQYLSLLTPDGSLVMVGLPVEHLKVSVFNLVHGRRSFAGSNIGGIRETQEMLDFCYQHNILAEGEVLPITQANEAFERLEKGDIHYRFVLDMQEL
ncbi:MAG: NAD(P)-dependent alcohol dehydrogenase [candidate division SR1 bacterium]|nr:NAD(P)-dependent alcohol dehydrogenase [candidate division SR1 bacterium]